jgi:hypothetical protein
MSLPAKGICLTHEPITNPSEIGKTWVTPSPESITVPVKSFYKSPLISSFPEQIDAHRARVACTPIKRPFTLKVSNIISAICSLFSGVLRGGSVKMKLCSSGSHLKYE